MDALALDPLRPLGPLHTLALDALRAFGSFNSLALNALRTFGPLCALTLSTLGTFGALDTLAFRPLRTLGALGTLGLALAILARLGTAVAVIVSTFGTYRAGQRHCGDTSNQEKLASHYNLLAQSKVMNINRLE